MKMMVVVSEWYLLVFLQWLVKRAIETREEMGDYIRSFSESQFSKNHLTPKVSPAGQGLHTLFTNGGKIEIN